MEQPKITILYRTNNRLRLKLSHPLRDVKQAILKMEERDGVKRVEYNPVTKSVLIHYNLLKIELEEVILRMVISYSKQYDMVPVKLVSNTPTRDIPSLAMYSVGFIIAAAAIKFLEVNSNKNIRDLLNWAALGTTAGAIVEHGYNEINEKGAFDPEVVSIMYLLNSIGKKNFIWASALTWITTFGRHILDFRYDELSIKVKEFKDVCTNEIYFQISLYHGDELYKKMNFVRAFLTNFIDRQNFCCGGNILMNKYGMGTNRGGHDNFNKKCSEIIVNNF
ncbi:hypothetical protein ACJDU8_07830 [Clostridium sp. WILCCON 0269]|uniref:Uncharacterized protein n=1 Tax=Candidatus Clostridium eludens TaxID=3381663 RepID=A0ABW8SJS2_9CLOT